MLLNRPLETIVTSSVGLDLAGFPKPEEKLQQLYSKLRIFTLMLNAETPLSANIVVADALISVNVNNWSHPALS